MAYTGIIYNKVASLGCMQLHISVRVKKVNVGAHVRPKSVNPRVNIFLVIA